MDYAATQGMHFMLALQGLVGNTSAVAALVLKFRAHPALLGYYLSDEPDGWGIPVSEVMVRGWRAIGVGTRDLDLILCFSIS